MAAMEGETSTAKTSSTSTRLYVGGLGERVTKDDLRNTFSNLGSLQSIDIIRTKGRSFAYINFLPSSDKSLAKLFSTYNGCSWKGGKLKLEKAKEHYIDRLKREWAEDAELKDSEHVDVVADKISSAEPKSPLDLENMQFRLFFPNLRKIKSLPLRGTGKHKYSFQRVLAPPHPVHFCDCPEHSSHAHTTKVAKVDSDLFQTLKGVPPDNTQNAGVNEEEFNMMNSVMNRLLGQDSAVNDLKIQDGVTQQEINVMNTALKKVLDKETPLTSEKQELQTVPEQVVTTSENQEENFIHDESDGDDIKINAVSGRNHGSFSSSSRERQRSLANQTPRSNERRDHGELAQQNRPGFPNRGHNSSNKRRKSLSNDTNKDGLSLPLHETKAYVQTQLKQSEEATLKVVTEPDAQKSTAQNTVAEKTAHCSSSKRKASWTKLIGYGNANSFSISQILP